MAKYRQRHAVYDSIVVFAVMFGVLLVL